MTTKKSASKRVAERFIEAMPVNVPEHVIAAAEASDPEGLVVSFDDEGPEVGSP